MVPVKYIYDEDEVEGSNERINRLIKQRQRRKGAKHPKESQRRIRVKIQNLVHEALRQNGTKGKKRRKADEQGVWRTGETIKSQGLSWPMGYRVRNGRLPDESSRHPDLDTAIIGTEDEAIIPLHQTHTWALVIPLHGQRADQERVPLPPFSTQREVSPLVGTLS